MIKNINKKTSGEILEVEIETKIKDFYSHKNRILTDDQVLEIVSKEYDILEMVSRPGHNVGNYRNSATKTKGVWIFKLKPKPKTTRKPRVKAAAKTKTQEKPLTKTSIRSKINKIAKKRNEEDESTE